MNRLLRSLRHQARRALSSKQEACLPEQSQAVRGIVSNGLRPLALEQRFMFDGAAVATVADAIHPDACVHISDVPAAVEVRAADPAQDHGKKEVVVVDTSVADYKTLEAGVAAGVGILEIDGSQDGLAQLAKWARGQSGYDSIAILSHGSEAALHLGSATITEASLEDSAVQAELATLGQALTADGDLLLYGCDVAKGSDGTAFISDLAKATGADVAASSDATGSAAKGGDWTLESRTGDIESKAAIDGNCGYSGLLAEQTINLAGSVTSGSLSSGIFTIGGLVSFKVTSSGSFTVTQSNGWLCIEETSPADDFNIEITDPSANGQFHFSSIVVDNQSTGGASGYGPQLGLAVTNSSTSVSSSILTKETGQNMNTINLSGYLAACNKVDIYDLEISGASEHLKVYLKDLVVDLDASIPTVSSISRSIPATSTTNADSLTWQVTFSEDVKNVDASDFTVSGTTAIVSSVVAVSANVYNVTVSGGDLANLEGAVYLGIKTGQNITGNTGISMVSNTPTGSNESYIVTNNTAPTLTANSVSPVYTENSSAVDIFGGVSAATNDSGQTFSGMSLTVSNVSNGANEILSIGGSDIALTDGASGSLSSGGSYSVSVDSGIATVDLYGMNLGDAQMANFVDGSTYRNASDNPGNVSRTVTITNVTDSGSNSNTASLNIASTVSVFAVNDTPTDISLSANSIGQSVGSNGTVGTLSATDVDSSIFTYTLVSGTGSTDNSLFAITGNTLKVNDAATMAAGSYSVRIQVSDGTDTYQKVFSVTVSDDVRPVFDLAPSADNIGRTGFDLSSSLNEAGTIYYVVVADGAPVPSVSQVIAGQNAVGSTAIASGYRVVSSSPYSYSFNVTGLNSGTSYDIYVVAKDSAGNQILSASKTDVTTTTNVAPLFSSLNGGSTYTENGSAVVIDSNVTVSDTELDALNSGLGNYSGASITIARNGGANTDDSFGNSGLLGTLTPGQDFTYNGTMVGSVTANSGGSLKLSFNSNATSAIVDAVLQSLTYANSSDDPLASVTLNWTFNDGSLSSSGSNQAVLSITPVNDAPVISTTSVSKTFNEDSAQTFSAADFGFSDVDSGDTLQSITIVTAPTAGELFIDANSDGVRDSGDTLLGNGAVVSAANIGKLTFRPAVNANGTGYSSFTWTVSDGTASSGNTGTMTLNVTPVNDAPVISSTSVSKTLNEDSAQTFSATDFGFSDVDSGDTLQSITIVTAPTAGELFIDANSDGVRGAGDTLLGNGAVVSAADIGKLAFRPVANASGAGYSTLTWKVSDGTASSGNTGTMTLNVTSGNDAPTLSSGVTVPLTPTTEDVTSSATTVSSLLSNAGYGDVDSGASSGIAITSNSGNGAWQYSTDSGANWFNIGTISASSALLLGSTAQIRYVPDSANGEAAFLVFSAWDQTSGTATAGASKGLADTSTSGGSSAFSTNSAQAALTVTSVNDAPIVSNPVGHQTATEDTAFSFTTPSNVFADIDTGDALTLNATLADGSALPIWLSFNPSTRTFSGTPGGSDVGDLAIRVTATDSGNASVSTTFSLSVAKQDVTPPTAIIEMSDTDLKIGESSSVTITFSEPVTGFDNSDLTVDGGVLSAVMSKDGGKTWTAVFTPDSGLNRAANAITLNMSGVKDLLNNSGVGSASSGNYVIDTAAPTAPTLNLSGLSDSGSSSIDGITKITTPTITGKADAGSTVTLYEGSSVLGSTTADSAGNWSITSSSLTEGGHSLTAKATDVVGNVSDVSSGLSITIDTTAPIAPTLVLDLPPNSGSSSIDGITSDKTPTITGTAEANSTVTLYEGSSALGSATADSSGHWSITSPSLTDGHHSLTAKATDVAGNVSGVSSGLSVTIDTAVPIAPTLNLSGLSDSGSSSIDGITKITTPTITGKAEAGSTVKLYEGSSVLGSAKADGSGNWSITSSSLTDGYHSLTAKATDVVGNVSDVSSGLSITIDTTAPIAPTLVLDLASSGGSSSIDGITSDKTPTITGTAEANSTVTLYEGSSVLGSAKADSSGHWSITSPSLTDGLHSLTAEATDAAGNVSAAGSLALIVDTHPVTNVTPGESGTNPSSGSPSSTPTSSAPAVAPGPSPESAAAPVVFLPASSAISNTNVVAETVSVQSGILSTVSSGLSASTESSVRAIEQIPLPAALTSLPIDSALVVKHGIRDLSLPASERNEISIPADVFAHSDPAAALSLSVTQANGRSLPGWVQFDQASGKLIVLPPEGYEGVLEVRVIARDGKGHEAVTTFRVVIGKGGKTLERAQSAGRASLSDQIHRAADRSGLRERLAAFARSDESVLRRRA